MPQKCLVILAAILQLSWGRRADLSDVRKPFYIIAHMANSVATMDSFLKDGANALEIDVKFEPNGAAWLLRHGIPCDYFRACLETTQLVDYLRAAASRNVSLLLFDLKSNKLSTEAKEFAGIDVARKLVSHFYDKGGEETNIVLSVPHVTEKPLLAAFIHEMRRLKPAQLAKISFDVSDNPAFHLVAEMFRELNVTSAWQGDGVTNWFEPFRGYGRVRSAVELRDGGGSYIEKVYRWTVDYKKYIRHLIEIGVDAVITNYPQRALEVVNELKEIRLARGEDDINSAFKL